MYFRMLTIEASNVVAKKYHPPFRWLVYHVAQVFMELLPHPLSLDGSSKVQITCGPRANPMDSEYESRLGASSYWCEGFDFENFYLATPGSKEEITLNLIETSLRDIVTRCSASAETHDAIVEAATAVRKAGFALKQRIKKLCRRAPSGGLSVEVYRYLNRDVGEAWSCEVVDVKGVVVQKVWMAKMPDYLDRRDFFKKSEWTGETFLVRTNLGEVSFALDMKSLSQST